MHISVVGLCVCHQFLEIRDRRECTNADQSMPRYGPGNRGKILDRIEGQLRVKTRASFKRKWCSTRTFRERYDLPMKASFPGSHGLRYHTNVGPICPPDRFPKRYATFVVCEDEDMGLSNPGRLQRPQAVFNQLSSDAASPPIHIDSKMMYGPSPAIMAAKYHSDDFSTRLRNEAHRRVSFEINLDCLFRICIA